MSTAPTNTRTPATSLSRKVAQLAHVLERESFPTGERAQLKRWSPGSPPGLAFYRFAFRYLPADWERQQEVWLTLVAGLALMCPTPHRPDIPLGRVLAETGYSETRLERLLAAEDTTLQTLVLRAARFMRAKNASCNWTDGAYLLGLGHAPREARLRIARNYYRELQRHESN